jgi:aspartokinase/homoserine dehydrogenase 1
VHHELSASTEETNWETITDTLIQYSDDLIFIDATGSEIAARQYLKLLSHGVHVTTPSKRANTFEQAYFDELITFPTHGLAEYKYETAVGAGLPVINTLQNLLDTGDTVTKISGVVSGTMTYIFNQLQQGIKFSTIIKSAKSEGYSEPDPRDDLSGEDVARKFLILARTCGYTFERDQIQVESLVPGKFDDLSVEQFLDSISEVDEYWEKRNAAALHQNKRLRYTGEFTSDTITIGIQEVDADSPLGGLQGTDNLIQIYTERYATSPIVIQGPGAGKEVTAAGVLSDVLQIGKNI